MDNKTLEYLKEFVTTLKGAGAGAGYAGLAAEALLHAQAEAYAMGLPCDRFEKSEGDIETFTEECAASYEAGFNAAIKAIETFIEFNGGA